MASHDERVGQLLSLAFYLPLKAHHWRGQLKFLEEKGGMVQFGHIFKVINCTFPLYALQEEMDPKSLNSRIRPVTLQL